MKKQFAVTRKTTESKIRVALDFDGVKNDYRKGIDTPIPFLNHMIEHIAWRAGINIETQISLDKFDLSHVITEDLGITFGKCVSAYLKENQMNGVVGFGDGIGIIDESYSTCAISFESRSLFVFDSDIDIPKETEGMLSEDLVTFLEGFVQGGNCTLHIDIKKGINAHHIWEAIFRSVGVALGRALAVDEKRVGMTSGVAGSISFEVE